MVYGYVRVSTDKQTVENQKFEIDEFAKKENRNIDLWIEETISGCKSVDERKLGELLTQMKKGDVLICAELSRLGRNLLMIMSVLNECMKNDIEVWTLKENYRLGNDISSKVLAFAFGLSAEIERNLISQRTKEALARKRAEGIVLGRPRGSRSKVRKLTGKEDVIKNMLEGRASMCSIARKLQVHRATVTSFVKDFLADSVKKKRKKREVVDSPFRFNYSCLRLNAFSGDGVSLFNPPPAKRFIARLQEWPGSLLASFVDYTGEKGFETSLMRNEGRLLAPPLLE